MVLLMMDEEYPYVCIDIVSVNKWDPSRGATHERSNSDEDGHQPVVGTGLRAKTPHYEQAVPMRAPA